MQFLPDKKRMSGTRSCGRSWTLTVAHIFRSDGRSHSLVRNDFEAGQNAKTVNEPSGKTCRLRMLPEGFRAAGNFIQLEDKMTILYHPEFRQFTHDASAAMMLSYFWMLWKASNRSTFEITITEIQMRTGLTRYEQQTARRILENLMILQTTRQGMPAKTRYILDFEQVHTLLGGGHV